MELEEEKCFTLCAMVGGTKSTSSSLRSTWRSVREPPSNYLLFPFWTRTSRRLWGGSFIFLLPALPRDGAPAPPCLETLGLPPLQQRFGSKTELLSALINLQVCSLVKQLICTLAPRPGRDLAVFSSLRNWFIHIHIVL